MTLEQIREWHERWKDGSEERPGMYTVGAYMMEPLIAVAEAAQKYVTLRTRDARDDLADAVDKLNGK